MTKITRLIEFKNKKGNVLRGVLVSTKNPSKRGVIFLHGFERVSTTEKKFTRLANELIKWKIVSFRFDYTGCGLSDGDFRYTTVKSMRDDFDKALISFKEAVNLEDVVVVVHSVSACVVAISKWFDKFSKIILLAPALNQKGLSRYWYVKSKNPEEKINWKNYKNFLDERGFEKYCEIKNRMTKTNYILNNYFLENKNKDYSLFFKKYKSKVLHIHGDKDEKVPLNSLNVDFPHKIIVRNGDHDLERPDMMKQWIKRCVNFIKK
ncbi:MAG: serine aminopeptidase domain-containing protein [Minisyncoccia bacterium]